MPQDDVHYDNDSHTGTIKVAVGEHVRREVIQFKNGSEDGVTDAQVLEVVMLHLQATSDHHACAAALHDIIDCLNIIKRGGD